MTNDHAITINRAPDVTNEDGSTTLGSIFVIADRAHVSWEQVLDVLRMIADGSPRRGIALFYVPSSEPQPPADLAHSEYRIEVTEIGGEVPS